MEAVFNQGSRIEFLADFDDRHGFWKSRKKISYFFGKSWFFAHFDPCLARNAKVIILRVEYGPTLRALVENVGGRGENLKIEKHSSNDAKKDSCYR